MAASLSRRNAHLIRPAKNSIDSWRHAPIASRSSPRPPLGCWWFLSQLQLASVSASGHRLQVGERWASHVPRSGCPQARPVGRCLVHGGRASQPTEKSDSPTEKAVNNYPQIPPTSPKFISEKSTSIHFGQKLTSLEIMGYCTVLCINIFRSNNITDRLWAYSSSSLCHL